MCIVIKSNIIYLQMKKVILVIETNPRSLSHKTLEALIWEHKMNLFNQKNNRSNSDQTQ